MTVVKTITQDARLDIICQLKIFRFFMSVLITVILRSCFSRILKLFGSNGPAVNKINKNQF